MGLSLENPGSAAHIDTRVPTSILLFEFSMRLIPTQLKKNGVLSYPRVQLICLPLRDLVTTLFIPSLSPYPKHMTLSFPVSVYHRPTTIIAAVQPSPYQRHCEILSIDGTPRPCRWCLPSTITSHIPVRQ